MAFTEVSCRFYVRTPAPGGHRYTSITEDLEGGRFPTTHPPAVGDLVGLGAHLYRVVDREWTLPAYGSANWRDQTTAPVGLLLIVEPADGLFVDEVDDEGATDDPH